MSNHIEHTPISSLSGSPYFHTSTWEVLIHMEGLNRVRSRSQGDGLSETSPGSCARSLMFVVVIVSRAPERASVL